MTSIYFIKLRKNIENQDLQVTHFSSRRLLLSIIFYLFITYLLIYLLSGVVCGTRKDIFLKEQDAIDVLPNLSSKTFKK